MRVQPLDREDPLEEEMEPTPGFLPGEFHGQGAWQVTVRGVVKSGTQVSTHAVDST